MFDARVCIDQYYGTLKMTIDNIIFYLLMISAEIEKYNTGETLKKNGLLSNNTVKI